MPDIQLDGPQKPVMSKLAVASYVLSMAGPCLFIPWAIATNMFINSRSNGPQDTTGLAFLPLYLAPLGLGLGLLALTGIRRSQKPVRGRNYALAAIVIGAIITCGLLALFALVPVLVREGVLA